MRGGKCGAHILAAELLRRKVEETAVRGKVAQNGGVSERAEIGVEQGSARKGEKTSVSEPGSSSSAGSWYSNDFPPPVRSRTRTSRPARIGVSARSCSLRRRSILNVCSAGYISLLYIIVLLVARRNGWNAGIYELFRWNCKIAPASPLSVDFYLFGRAERPVLQCLYNIFDKLGTDSGTLQQTGEAVGMID